MARKKREEAVVRASLTLNEQDCSRLREIADSLEVSLAWVLRRACSEYLERHQLDSEGDSREGLVLRPLGGGPSKSQ